MNAREYLDNFARRVLQDALSEALPNYWERRADTFDAVGNARCATIAEACRRKAAHLRTHGLDPEAAADVETILREVS